MPSTVQWGEIISKEKSTLNNQLPAVYRCITINPVLSGRPIRKKYFKILIEIMRKAERCVLTFKKSLFKYWLFTQYLMHKELRHIYEKAGTQKQKLSFKNGLTPLCLSAIYVYLLLSSMMVCAIRDDFYLLYRLVVAFLFIAPPLLHIGFAPKSHHFFWKKRGYSFILPRILYIPQQF